MFPNHVALVIDTPNRYPDFQTRQEHSENSFSSEPMYEMISNTQIYSIFI